MSNNQLYQLIIFVCLSIYSSLSLINETNVNKAVAKPSPKVCGDVRITLFEVRRGLDFQALAACEIILGSVTYAPMHSLTDTNLNATPVHFPYLREIYGHILLGYSSAHSFHSMFPRLAILHGRELYHGYSLIIMDNFLLDDLGFISLISIRRGNVMVARNAQLCYAESLHWNEIFEDKNSRIISRQNRENCAFCPTCPSACWSPSQCQKHCSTHCKGNCYSETICCPEQCVGGCYYNNNIHNQTATLTCNACRNMRIYETGECVQQCPQTMLKAGSSLCVTRNECKSFFMGTGFILDEINECVSSCPSGFLRATGSHCVRCLSSPENNYCYGACAEKHIRSIADFQSIKYCTRIHTLNIYNIETVEFHGNHYLEAFAAFSSLEQIDHEFTIHNVKVFSTLSIFSHLKRIDITSKATVTIEENEFLTELWPLKQPPLIVQGNLNIVRNARLCLKEIQDFINHTREQDKDLQVTSNTYNEYANGYLASCESNDLTITVDKIGSLSAQINVAIPKQIFFRSTIKTESLRRSFLSVYYKSTKTKNETHFDSTQAHKWQRLVEQVNHDLASYGTDYTMTVKLPSLIGDQWYAVYVSITSNVNTIGLFSPINYFRTLQRQPESVVNLYGQASVDSSIRLMWQPPMKPNGPIVTYLVYYALIEDRLPVQNTKLLCLMKNLDHWRTTGEILSVNEYNPDPKKQCDHISNRNNDGTQKKDVDQVIIDLSILEQQLINSVGQRKNPLVIQQELKETIILDLDKLFENQNSSENDQADSQEQTVVEHKPYINQYNQSVSNTNIQITGLKRAQLYMFQVYACHDINQSSLSDACSASGIITTIRTKPGHPSKDVVRRVKIIELKEIGKVSDSKSLEYQISWLKPIEPNGLIYFYLISIEQNANHGPKQEFCVGNDTRSINVTLLPRTHYRLRIITYTIARLNNEYNDLEEIQDGSLMSNRTDLFYFHIFTTKDLPSDLIRQNRAIALIFIIGSIVVLLIVVFGAICYYYTYGRQVTKVSISKNPNYELYTPDQWEIDKDSVTVERFIGQGHFGQVYQGVLKLHDGTFKPCAVKTRTTHPTDLLQEASIMKQFQCHHVIQLYGICSRIRPPYVVMELMEHGDLKSYLYRHRQSDQNIDGPSLSESAMIQLALDVADGMYYLSDQKFVHRDLAARNCLVNRDHTCKVGDFGLARDIYETDYYRRGGRSFLPIRWMAPESLRDGRFDTVSDVWSFGVLLWEIVTLAEQPYQGYANEEVVHYVRYGNITLECPMNCPEILHKLMRDCWTYSPTDRIQFRAIVKELLSYQNEDFRLHAYYHTQPNIESTPNTNETVHHHHDEEDLLLAEDDNESVHV